MDSRGPQDARGPQKFTCAMCQREKDVFFPQGIVVTVDKKDFYYRGGGSCDECVRRLRETGKFLDGVKADVIVELPLYERPENDKYSRFPSGPPHPFSPSPP